MEFPNGEVFERKSFKSFDGFVKYLDGDLSDANLLDYDFKDVDLTKYNLKGAGIRKSLLDEKGLHDNFYEENVNIVSNDLLSSLKDVEPRSEHTDISTEYDASESNFKPICYITDLHLDHKIRDKFPDYATEYEIRKYIKEIVKDIGEDFQKLHGRYLMVGGDVSFSLKISRLFYEELIEYTRNIIAILGNHELWGYGIVDLPEDHEPHISLDTAIESYQKMFDELGIIFIQNGIFFSSYHKHVVITENEVQKLSIEELRNICSHNYMTIFGGIGFSGYDKSFNANNGIYRNTIDSLDEEIIQTRKFENIYRKMVSAASDLPIIVFTHMPKESWTSDTYNPNWIYVNGHTHRNVCYEKNGAMIYGDNQIGYESTSFHLKRFLKYFDYDTFKDYADGIYEITRDQYVDFYHGLRQGITFNRDNCKIYLLKNTNVHCFIYENKNGVLSLLNGGKLKKLDRQNISYYYDNLKIYADAVNDFMDEYYALQKNVSKAIKEIGGDGHIHGCIVDIDYLNHVYVNPLDGKLTPYYAESVIHKWVFGNVGSLLQSKNKDLYKKYVKMIDSGKKDALMIIDPGSEIDVHSIYVPETDIYAYSRIISGLQYTKNFNIVRVWNDDIINMDAIDRKRNIVRGLLKGSD